MKIDIDQFQAQEPVNLLPGPISSRFLTMPRGRGVHKWLHYLPVYERVFAPFRDKAVMLEIGVCYGGSLDLWRRYFGPDATLFGIDINPECADRVTAPNQVRIGSQADPDFLRSVVSEMGRPNIVLDDGSHVGEHQISSFRTLWPLLEVGGVYIIEDMHTHYWEGMGGGFDLVKALIDDMHGWYHEQPSQYAPREELGAIHIHDSIVVIEKTRRQPPRHTYRGG